MTCKYRISLLRKPFISYLQKLFLGISRRSIRIYPFSLIGFLRDCRVSLFFIETSRQSVFVV